MSATLPVKANIETLQQAVDMLNTIDDSAYRAATHASFDFSLGSHLRHLYDHYQLLLDRYGSGRVDYDDRARDPRMETDRIYALDKINELIHRLENLEDRDMDLFIKMDCKSACADPWTPSTLKRELMYLAIHDVHHFALIAFILKFEGIETAPGFGIAPSTLKHLGKSG